MGLGPSIKMTTLHHYNCPVTRRLIFDPNVDFAGVIENGVSENYDAKVATAEATGELAKSLGLDGAIVAIDGWGNHHIDFINVIEQLGIRGIPSVGLSFIGLQGRLVATNPYVKTIIDFNKGTTGYESCVVGQNNLTDLDAYKAIQILKSKVRKSFAYRNKAVSEAPEHVTGLLTRQYAPIRGAEFGDHTGIADGVLTLRRGLETELVQNEPRIKAVSLEWIRPDSNKRFFVNSNLDFMPVACKISGKLGEGVTRQLDGVTVMLNGVEDVSGFQPANIGSSEGILSEQVKFDEAGTPASSDIILHMDFLFEEEEGRTAEGIWAAHQMADRIIDEIRSVMTEAPVSSSEKFVMMSRPSKMRIGLIKVCSGLGNMYDTAVFPNQPGGLIGATLTREQGNPPIYMTPCEVLDGVIHSLI